MLGDWFVSTLLKLGVFPPLKKALQPENQPWFRSFS